MRVNIGRLEGNGHAYMVKYRMFPVLCWVVVNSVNETKARGHSFFFFFCQQLLGWSIIIMNSTYFPSTMYSERYSKISISQMRNKKLKVIALSSSSQSYKVNGSHIKNKVSLLPQLSILARVLK